MFGASTVEWGRRRAPTWAARSGGPPRPASWGWRKGSAQRMIPHMQRPMCPPSQGTVGDPDLKTGGGRWGSPRVSAALPPAPLS